MTIASEYPYLRPRVSLAERFRHVSFLLVVGIGALSLLAMGLAIVMFFAMFFLPSYAALTDDSFLSANLTQWLLIVAMVPCIGITLAGSATSLFQRLWSGVIVGAFQFGCLVMLAYSISYIERQWQFRDATQANYVFRIAQATPCGRRSVCVDLVWDGSANPDITINRATYDAIEAHPHSSDVPNSRSETPTGYCVSLPVERAGDAARIPLRKNHYLTLTDFFACPPDIDILQSWPPRH